MLGTLPSEKQSEWKSHIGMLVHAYNCTWNLATGLSPYYLMYGRQLCILVDVTLGLAPHTTMAPNTPKFVQEMQEHAKWVQEWQKHSKPRKHNTTSKILLTDWTAAGQPPNVECKCVYLTLRRWQTIQHLDPGWPPDIMLCSGDIAKFSWGM